MDSCDPARNEAKVPTLPEAHRAGGHSLPVRPAAGCARAQRVTDTGSEDRRRT